MRFKLPKITGHWRKFKVKTRRLFFTLCYRLRLGRIATTYRGLHITFRVALPLAVISLIILVVLVPNIGSAAPQSLTITRDDFLSGTSDFGDIKLSDKGRELQLQSGLVGKWDESTNPGIQGLPHMVDGISNLIYGPNDTLYLMAAFERNCYFSIYSIETKSWTRLNAPPATCGAGTILEFDGEQSLYYLPGGPSSSPSNQAYRYNISSDSWTALADFPSNVSDTSSGSIVSQGTKKYLYIFRGMGSPSFWRYDIANDSWSNLSSFPTAGSVSYGISLVWDRANYLYAIVNHTGEFKRYDLSTSSWSNLTAVPASSYVKRTLVYSNGIIISMSLNWSTENPQVQSYDTASGTWSTHPKAPTPNIWDYQLPLAYDGSRYGYALMGLEIRPEIQRFDFQNNKWSTLSLFSPTDDNSGAHRDIMYDGTRYIYYAGGTYSGYVNRMYRFDTTTNTTLQIGSQIANVAGSTGAYYNGALYLLSYGLSTFQKFDLSTNSYVALSDLPTTIGEGSRLVDGGDGYLYVIYGLGRTNFSRYHIASNTWTNLMNSPQAVYGGGSTDRIGRFIYVIAGNNSAIFMRYSMDTNTWATLPSLPNGSLENGSFISSDGSRYLYVSPNARFAATSRKMYRYDTVSTGWQRVADLPADGKYRASADFDETNNALYVAQGSLSPALWRWHPGSSSYSTSGTWVSKTYDLTQVQAWISFTKTIAGTGDTKVYTRTSSDSRIWSEWQEVSGDSIQSPTNRYFQFKVVLTGDGSSTPTVSNFSLQYSQEETAPTLPSQLTSKSSRLPDAETIQSGRDYEHQHPYFSWSGSSDGANGSGLEGYYVYFGTNSNADPVTDGNYQTTSDYVVSSPMIAGEVYYLRIKSRDRLGNTSDAATFFSYRYFYISPPGSIIKSTGSDFSQGTNNGIAVSGNTMKLRSSAEGSWSTGPNTMPPDNTYGASMVVTGDSIYVARGANTATFWRYDLEALSWSTLSPIPSNVSTGSSMTHDGAGNIYLIAGNNTASFYKYNIENDSWLAIGNGLPATAQPGTDITYIGGGKFLILFTGVREFYSYDSNNNSFSPLSTYPTTISNSGSGIWFDGNDSVYVYMGAWTWSGSRTSRISMAKYTISTDTWRPLADSPVVSYYTQNNLVSDGRGNLYTFANTLYNNLPKSQRMMRYSIADDSWHQVDNLQAEMFHGTATSDGSRYIYLLPGGSGTSSRKLIRYDSWTNTFTPTTKNIDPRERISFDVSSASQWVGGNSSAAVYDGNKYIYAIAGNESTSSSSLFVKFDYRSGDTQHLPPPPLIGVAGSLALMDNILYYLPGKNTREFYKYEEVTQQWVRLADTPDTVYRPGTSSLVAVNGVLYAPRGNNTTHYYRFTPDAGMGSWSTVANLPGTTSNGSASVYDASSNSIFFVRANGTSSFYRYNISTNAWTTLSSLPDTSSYGATLVLKGDKIYAQRGNATKTSYIYSISGNSWSRSANAPENFSYGSMALKTTDLSAVIFAGQSIPDIWQFNFPSENTAFEGRAVHISEPMETPGIFDYAGITAQVTTPDNTSVEIWTRTSDDGVQWDDWKIATEIKRYQSGMSGAVQSKAKRFTQIKIVLESNDNLYSPTVQSYALHYYYDVDPPTNPTLLNAYSDNSKTVNLTNSVWYNYNKPTFDWPDAGEAGGPTDGPLGSNIAGYWVYVGTDPTASPRTQGVFIKSSEYTPKLSIPGTYYVRMQTQDLTGNVDGSIFAPFIYKFDNTPPTNPALVSVTPSGFTTQNDFSFDWPNAFDAHSGVAGYCYHTGANSGPFAADICQSGTSLKNLSIAYRTGTNVFYVRAYDIAGNYAPAYTSVSYYYTTDPPGPVTSLRAVPPTSTQNMFAFAWDLPAVYSGDPNQLIYCYSVNVLPSPTNTTCTSERFIPAFKAATQQGTNILYIVSKDEANNANWNNFASANFIANTVSPGIPLNVVPADTSDRATNRWSITLTWDTPTFQGNGIKDYIVERSPDGHTFSSIGNTSNRAYVDLDIVSDTQYFYRIRAQDGVNNVGGASGVVSKMAQGFFTQPPEIVVAPSATSDFDQARIKWVTSRGATSFVYYGTSPNNLTQSKGTLDSSLEHTQILTGLQPSTTYYYRVQSFDERRNYNLNDAYSDIASFQTAAAAQVENVGITDITSGSAVISWDTSIPTKFRIVYGSTQDYGFEAGSAEDQSFGMSHTFRLSNLPSGSLQHMKIVATTNFGSSFSSDDYTFTTVAKPAISNVRFQPVDGGPTAGALVTWTTNVPTSSTVFYTASGVRLEKSTSEMTMQHEALLSSLASNTEYEVTIEGRDQYGNLGSSPLQRWRSSLDTRPPKIIDTVYSVTTTGSGGNKKAQLIISWKTDEPATAQVQYDQGDKSVLGKKSALNTQPTNDHTIILSDLSLADIYKVRITSRDLDGNTAYGSTTTVVTPDKAVSAYDNVLDLIMRLFKL